MERASQHAETSSVVSSTVDSSSQANHFINSFLTCKDNNDFTLCCCLYNCEILSGEQNQGKHLPLTEPRPPQLETSLRARPPR